ncbi:MAG: 2,3,4,5-tetrahydropyridine-2,6-dicarboxylate N-succinyltransferase [Alphaproteobacteria bacterium]|nr:2,3,4,5-tetrahydropyridine-2,6-dicarboxylate N-succinyltransferase [Alphaproteobacteria bacterium]NDC56862.1 2,3,4,5-tetrahydropyridine-2,6-dicarboxylate N-succinyltransferase [Alphaproteobacteria bacterium]NDG05348.1 2,3,4,5-tetrahydropyridine-2,6-dicarboxylate N-succinyltransferase [Alphaproteobacteria bacterium]
MTPDACQKIIDGAFAEIGSISPQSPASVHDAVAFVLDQLEKGAWRVAEKDGEHWKVNAWIKQAILLSFRLQPNRAMTGAPDGTTWWDKIPLRHAEWSPDDWKHSGFRAVPGSLVRRGSHIAPGVVLMPCFINVGAYVGANTMIDTWATVGSCAHIGANCHISGGVGVGGVLEPLQAAPVIIEDDCFIGARSEVAEGVRVCTGSVISMGVFLGASTKIVNRATGEISHGVVPPYSVVVPGTLPGSTPRAPSLACAVIVKQVDENTRRKTSLNDLLRDIS